MIIRDMERGFTVEQIASSILAEFPLTFAEAHHVVEAVIDVCPEAVR
jgi:hypothetical protein